VTAARILIVEDDPDGRQSVADAIADAGLAVETAATGRQGVAAARTGAFDAVLSDLVLPDIDGIEVMREILAADSSIPVLIMTAYGSVESSVRALKAGAYDYITKPLDLDDLQAKVMRAVETHRLRREVVNLRQSLGERYGARAIVAHSAAMQQILRQVGALAATNATVLISGESGTGKELVARALHYDGGRAAGPFVAVNCGALSENLLESELFGHEKGAFTGAVSQHPGAFERADGGTLLLDEVGDAPRSVQVKLLRALEEREVTRVGGQKSVKVDARVISASNRDLAEMVRAGDFREDLFYRLKVVSLAIPPLRERREDIRPLADRFIAGASLEHDRPIERVLAEFYEALERYDWPGNVRELRNVVDAAVILSTEPVLRAAALRFDGIRRGDESAGFSIPNGMTLSEIERRAIVRQLERFDGNRTLAADALGLCRRTVQRKIKEHKLPF
jgi:DNA-binding NtrC family response regulator